MQKNPICAPRYCGSAATDCRVSGVARNNRSYIWRLFWSASAASSAGRVNTTWKYSQSSSSACLFSNHLALAKDWHLGQWRSAHELYALRSWPHGSHRSRWPPSAAVRQRSMACSTRFCPTDRDLACAWRNASPWARTMSATSNVGRTKRTAAYFGESLTGYGNRSKGLVTAQTVLVVR